MRWIGVVGLNAHCHLPSVEIIFLFHFSPGSYSSLVWELEWFKHLDNSKCCNWYLEHLSDSFSPDWVLVAKSQNFDNIKCCQRFETFKKCRTFVITGCCWSKFLLVVDFLWHQMPNFDDFDPIYCLGPRHSPLRGRTSHWEHWRRYFDRIL